METIDVFVDGSCRYHRYIAIGIYNKSTCEEYGAKIPHAGTVNEAEYLAVIKALSTFRNGVQCIRVHSDSQLVVNQLTGKYKVNKKLQNYFRTAKKLERYYEKVVYIWIPRTENTIANAIAQRQNGLRPNQVH